MADPRPRATNVDSARCGAVVSQGSIAADALDRIVGFHWQGNVRELKNMIERLVIMVQSDSIGEKDLPRPLW